MALTKALHLKSAVTALPDGTIIGNEPMVDDRSVFGAFLAVPEEPGAHVVLLGDGKLLTSSAAHEPPSCCGHAATNRCSSTPATSEKLEGLRDVPVSSTPRHLIKVTLCASL
ncbi:MAG TPA: hypothetical protein VFK56_20805 [Mycobacterium sp.]|nr:hypothetical protein [Mycobacterium sp.]